MKHHDDSPLYAAAGLLALALRLLLELLGRDARGLLIPTHPLALVLWAVTGAACLCSLIRALRAQGLPGISGSGIPLPGSFVMAAGIALSLVLTMSEGLRLFLPRMLTGLLAVAALVRTGLCRRKGTRPFFGCHAIVCLYLALHTVSRYQTWSSHPQLLNFFFPMMGCLLLTVYAYCRTAAQVELLKGRLSLAVSSCGIFFCIAALSAGQDLFLYAAGALWMLAEPVSLRRSRPEEDAV